MHRNVAVEIAADGSIYTLTNGRTGSAIPPVFPTADVVYYGSFRGGGSGNNVFTYVSKYSADGSNLEWVRVLAPETATNGGINLRPFDLELNPATGEVVVLTIAGGGPIANDLITSDAQFPNPPPVFEGWTGSNNQTLVLNKFSPSGALVYGSYFAKPEGGTYVLFPGPLSTGFPQVLEISEDGSIYAAFRVDVVVDQTGIIPTTAGALSTTLFGGTEGTVGSFFTILNPDNTVRYATYWIDSSPTNGNLGAYEGKIAPNGDYYVLLNSMDESLIGYTSTSVIDPTTRGTLLMRVNSSGTIIGDAYIPNTANELAIRPNGNVIASDIEGNLYEYNEDLTSLINQTTPFVGGLYGNLPTDIELDEEGRIHFVTFDNADGENPFFSTEGALSTADGESGGYYGILDCNLQDIVYATKVESTNPIVNANDWMQLYDIEVVGCTAYITGESRTGVGFPVTPTAFNDDGTASISGYNITPAATTGQNWRDGALMAFNYPVLEANTNVLTAPALTTFCLGSTLLPIDGTEANFLTPSVIGLSDDNPVSTPTHYQWEVATSAGGPWTIIADSDEEDFSPEAPATAGDYFYRRTVRQTPFGEGFCVPTCDVEDVSNIIQLTFSNDVTHATNITEDPYAICSGMSSLALDVNITPSTDGENAPYAYKLTTTTNLVDVALGQSGSVPSVGTPISLTVDTAGDYILQVTDSRGCVSFDTLVVENLKLDAGDATKFTCDEPTVQLGPFSPTADYVNFPINTVTWSVTTGSLNDPNLAAPIFTHGLATGGSTKVYLTYNGCLVDSIEVVNDGVDPLPALPPLALCQGDTLRLGTSGPGTNSLITEDPTLTYQWAPGLGLVTNDEPNPILTTPYAPQGVNTITYTLLANSGASGCSSTTTQEVTVYRQPRNTFSGLPDCMINGCDPTSTLQFPAFGTPSEPGISYSWTATVVDAPGNVGTTGLPTDAEALGFLSDPTASEVTLDSGVPGLGYADQYGYTITYVRTSFNTADPSCMRTDTARLVYCCGPGGLSCEIDLGGDTGIACGGAGNEIGAISGSGNYIWTRVDGQPLDNELFLIGSGTPLDNVGPHPFRVVANPSGLSPVVYRLTRITINNDTCSVDIEVYPGASSTPNVAYPSTQDVCDGDSYTLQGPVGQPSLDYLWSPSALFATPADTVLALPTLAGLTTDDVAYVTVTDPLTACFVVDTVEFLVTEVALNAGSDDTFCSGGADIDIGAFAATPGYTYQWTAVPAAGVVFDDPTAAQTGVTLPPSADGDIIKLYLTGTNNLTAENCMLTDSIILTSDVNAPTISIPTVSTLCAGGEITIGPVTPSGAVYLWTGPGIVSGQGTDMITVNQTGTYDVSVTQGTCTNVSSVAVVAPTDPTVDLAPAAACASDVTIGAVSMTTAQKAGWFFTWDNYTGLKGNASDFSTITVRPTVTTTYTLTATHSSGCVQTFPVLVPAAAYSAELPTTLNFCEGDAAVLPLNDFSDVGGSVVWTADPVTGESYLNSTTAGQPTIDISAAERGRYTFTATVTYPTGCVSTASTTVNIGKSVENIAGFDREICIGECTQLGTTPITGVNYTWTAMPADPTLISLAANPTVCPTVNTVYTLTYRDASGCSFEDEVEVQVLTSPTLMVMDMLICQNETGTATLDLATAVVSHDGISLSYWQNAEATISLPSSTVNYPGTFYIQSTGSNGCTAIQPVVVEFNELPIGSLIPSFTCAINAGSIQISNATATARYDYSVGNSYIGSATYATASPLSNGAAIITGLVIQPGQSQAYTVRLFADDEACFRDYTTVIVSEIPVVALNDPADVCLDDSAMPMLFTGMPTDANGVFTTTATAGLTDNGDGTASLDPTIAGAGVYDVAYTYTNAAGCEASDTVSVEIFTAPVVTVAEPATLCSTQSIDLTVGASITPVSLAATWSTPDGDVANFDNGTTFGIATTYTPSAADAARGSVTLVLTTDDPDGPCGAVSAMVTFTILQVDCGTFPWGGE